MNQEQRLLQWLAAKPITFVEAWFELGITRLSAQIYTLRKQGYSIVKERVITLNPLGEECSLYSYRLLGRLTTRDKEEVPETEGPTVRPLQVRDRTRLPKDEASTLLVSVLREANSKRRRRKHA